jgi:hypothetical protein
VEAGNQLELLDGVRSAELFHRPLQGCEGLHNRARVLGPRFYDNAAAWVRTSCMRLPIVGGVIASLFLALRAANAA